LNKNNTSGTKGVVFDKRRGFWIGQISLNRKNYSKGFKKIEDAVAYRNIMFEKLHKPYLKC
jgi:hypothetical protein